MRREEYQEQVALFNMLSFLANKYPVLHIIFAITNESYGGGIANIRRGAAFKAMGRKRGVPDICIPIARNGYHGLWVEMKTKKGRQTKEQKWYEQQLMEQEYLYKVCRGFDDALRTICEYVGIAEDDYKDIVV